MFTSSADMNAHYRRDHPSRVEACALCHIAAKRGHASCPLHGALEDSSPSESSVGGNDVREPELADASQVSDTAVAPNTAEANQSTADTHAVSGTDLPESAPLLLRPAEEIFPSWLDQDSALDPSSESSVSASTGDGGAPRSEDADTEAGATEAGAAPAVAHAPQAVPDDWERASASDVSDCASSWTEVSSVRSEDLAAVEVISAASDDGRRIDERDRAIAEDNGAGGASELEQMSQDVAADVGMAEKCGEECEAERRSRGAEGRDKGGAAPVLETPTDLENASAEQASGTQTASAASTPAQSSATGQMFLTCKACTKSPTSPIVTMCGHVFCHRCILNALTSTLSCPTCHRPIFVKLEL
ncbi:Ring finger domain-containing protein [Phanerochaete sordida]|uniref:Ring finger domain-containing protein n=1 Tax=Phanerochaete sordida TaxID=48140 RepID=A0A9P3G229_9APHY|nr:Ring finger domain-containing protein [Phanerochaete sordida]